MCSPQKKMKGDVSTEAHSVCSWLSTGAKTPEKMPPWRPSQ